MSDDNGTRITDGNIGDDRRVPVHRRTEPRAGRPEPLRAATTLRPVPRFVAALAALAALLPAAVAASGCGSDDLPSVSPAEAAASTRDAETARMTAVMKIAGLGLPAPMTVKADGVTALAQPRMDFTADFGPMLALLGAGGDGKTRFVLDGSRFLVDPPPFPGLEIPGGATWVTADLGKVVKAFGVDASGFGDLMRVTPDQQLAGIQATKSIKKVGEDEIDGVRTTHLKGTLRLSDFVRALPAAKRARVQKALRELDKLPGGDESVDAPMPTEMWIDEDKRLRRMKQSTRIPGQKGVPSGRFEITMDLGDFGTKLDLPNPSGDDVWDATDTVTRALRQAEGAVPS